MLRCLTKKKVNCSFQSNVFRFKKRFLHIFILAFFFFHFFGLHWMKLRNGILKIMGVCLERRAKKEEKTVLMEKKTFKKRPGRDSNPRSSVLPSPLPWQQRYQYTRPTPYHLATEPCTPLKRKLEYFKQAPKNARGQLPEATIIKSTDSSNNYTELLPLYPSETEPMSLCCKDAQTIEIFENN